MDPTIMFLLWAACGGHKLPSIQFYIVRRLGPNITQPTLNHAPLSSAIPLAMDLISAFNSPTPSTVCRSPNPHQVQTAISCWVHRVSSLVRHIERSPARRGSLGHTRRTRQTSSWGLCLDAHRRTTNLVEEIFQRCIAHEAFDHGGNVMYSLQYMRSGHGMADKVIESCRFIDVGDAVEVLVSHFRTMSKTDRY